MRSARLPLLALLLPIVAGCGADAAESTGTTINSGMETIPGAEVLKIDAGNFSFSIRALRMAPGEDLTIALHSTKETHDFVVDDGKLPVRVAVASEGVTALGGLRAPDTPGNYVFYCSILGHRAEGMEGELVVA